MDEEEFAELAAGHALGALSAEDERRFTEALAAHPAWARIAEDDAATVAALTDEAPDIAPPSSVREALLSQIVVLPQEGDPPVPAPPARRRWTTRAWFALAAALVVIASVGVGTTIAVQNALRSPAVVALEQIEAASDSQAQTAEVEGGGTATLHWSTSLGTAVLVTDGLPALSDQDAFEMWLVRGESALPAGVFASGATTTALIDGTMRPGDIVAVTIEPAGGSPTGQPTTEPILAIATS